MGSKTRITSSVHKYESLWTVIDEETEGEAGPSMSPTRVPSFRHT